MVSWKGCFVEIKPIVRFFFEYFVNGDLISYVNGESFTALIVNDDWGFKTQTILSPDMLRQFVFPWHKRIVESIYRNGKYAILHSCGNLSEVIDDIVDELKYDVKHSFEDNILPVEQAWKLWHEKIAILAVSIWIFWFKVNRKK